MNTKQNAGLKSIVQISMLALLCLLLAPMLAQAQMSVEVEGDVVGENAGLTDSMILGGRLGIGPMETGEDDPQARLHLRNADAGDDPGWVSGADQMIIEDDTYSILQFFTPNDMQAWIEFSDTDHRCSGAVGYDHDLDRLEFWTRYGETSSKKMYIAPQGVVVMTGVYGTPVGANVPVVINSIGKLGTTASSIRYKENVRDIEDMDTSFIYELRPRIFDYKAPLEGTDQCGLIAEEVEKVAPQIVIYRFDVTYEPAAPDQVVGDVGDPIFTKTDEPDGVNYPQLIVPMLAEMQKMRAEIDMLKQCILELEAAE